jgi:hypothetical protein
MNLFKVAVMLKMKMKRKRFKKKKIEIIQKLNCKHLPIQKVHHPMAKVLHQISRVLPLMVRFKTSKRKNRQMASLWASL